MRYEIACLAPVVVAALADVASEERFLLQAPVPPLVPQLVEGSLRSGLGHEWASKDEEKEASRGASIRREGQGADSASIATSWRSICRR